MPDASISLVAACLWDLRAQAERQLRCLTSAQRTVDGYRGAADAADRTRLLAELGTRMIEVREAQDAIGQSMQDVAIELHRLAGGGTPA
jgi:hypothetical protein